MATPSNDRKNWADLTALARKAGPPEIDVRASVRRAITASAPIRHPRTAPEPSALRGWLLGSFAAIVLLTAITTYAGLQAAPELSLALDFSTSF